MNTKVCKQCGCDKSTSEFYKISHNSDGFFGKCKECIKANVRSNRSLNIDYYRTYDKARSNRIDRVLAREAYAKTPDGIASANAAKLRWSISNKIKRAATHIVNNSVRRGDLIKPSICSCCNTQKKRIEGHHCDYAKPLDVVWMCSKCHREWHKENIPINGD